MEKYRERINIELKKYLTTRSGQPIQLNESVAYSLMAKGKRLRPALILATCETLGGDIESALPFAMAMEMIHTYSLIHDDLPAMDDDDLRRGVPTNHVVYGEGIAVLAGDRLLNLAYEIMAKACLESGKKHTLKAMDAIATAAGKMVDGQSVDILSDGSNMNKNKLRFIHRNKTAALIMASVEVGAILAGTRTRKLEKLRKVGYLLGMGYQVKDDYLEIVSTEDQLGKSKSDVENNKFTYVTLYGEKRAKAQVNKIKNEIVSLLGQLNLKNSILRDMATEILSLK